MSLSSVMQLAQNSLSNMTRRTGVLARNINEVGNEFYARRDLQTISLASGAQVSNIRRSTDARLERAAIDTTSANSAQRLLENRLSTLSGLLAGENSAIAVTDRLADLHNSLQTYSATPNNLLLGGAVVDTAKSLVASLHDATKTVQDFRTSVDNEIGQTVAELNSLLSDFRDANDQIRQGTALGQDVNDALDRRGALLDSIAQIVPVSSFTRNNNDMVLLTASGATLFETEPRSISFTPSTAMAPGMVGNPVLVDVVKLSFGPAPNSSATGSLDALLRLRDNIAPKMQEQLDETAHALVTLFAESDLSGSFMAKLQGLFAWPGGPAFPTSGIVIDGFSAGIFVNQAYDPASGGSVTRLRDGGANGAAYNANPSGLPAFADRLIKLAGAFDEPLVFDGSAGLGTNISILKFSGLSGGWLSGLRSGASQAADIAEAKHARIRENLSNLTGVNMDIEMAKLGELENGYQASARLLATADQMLKYLLDSVG